MTKTDFLAAFSKAPQSAWEEGALQAALRGEVLAWPFVEVPLTVPAGLNHSGSVFVASDMFSVGAADDFLRLPLAPIAAQRIANLGGYLLPTRKIAQDIWKTARDQGVILDPRPATAFGQENRGPNLLQYASHNAVIDEQTKNATGSPSIPLLSGHKKDVVISNEMKPGRVVIYGWFNKDGTRIQPLTNVHDDHYADYSHGIRMVAPDMIVDGQVMRLEDVLRDPTLASLVSDEGPLREVRYPTPGTGPGSLPAQSGGTGVATSESGTRGWTAALTFVSPVLALALRRYEAQQSESMA